MILGGGPNRIGQGIEFDYCCVHAVFALREAGLRDDHGELQPGDGLHRLRHLRPALLRAAHARGRAGDRPPGEAAGGHRPVRRPDAAQAGGAAREARGCPSSGPRPTPSTAPRTASASPSSSRSSGLRQPENGVARSAEEAFAVARRIGYPVMVRPSYVLGGRAMEVVYDDATSSAYLTEAVQASHERPVLVDRFLKDAAEVDVDVVSDGRRGGRRRGHGAHRGGGHPLRRLGLRAAAPFSSRPRLVAEIEDQSIALARELSVVGLMNVQFAIQGQDHLRPRGESARQSRTVPFVGKATGRAAGQDGARSAWWARRWPRAGASPRDARAEARVGEGGGLPLRPLPAASTPCSGRR